jgi:molybdopterin molybdotransferase
VATLSFADARECVVRTVQGARRRPGVQTVPLEAACGRVLAEDVRADRDIPALDRSVRDGFAVRAADLPGRLRVIGEVRAGERFHGSVGPGEAVEIMTGAPVPAGADAVEMVEYASRDGDAVVIERPSTPGQFINPRAGEARRDDIVLRAGSRLDYSSVAFLASAGREQVPVFARILAAILPTGDEIVEVGETPLDHQIRNSNAWSLAAQVARAGAVPVMIPVARDNAAHTREMVVRGLECDILLLSGGVSAGRYDVVEEVLAGLGACVSFDRVLIQPGQPLVFGDVGGQVGGKFFFGLPGNPASTMVTFEVFARAAIELLGGCEAAPLHMPFARLTEPFRHRPGLTRFLPARLGADGAEVAPLRWSGSGDVPALTRADCYLVADADRAEYPAGEWIRVLAK